MKFSEIEYTRPDIEVFKTEFTALLQTFAEAGTAEAQSEALLAINHARSEFNSMRTVAHVRHTIDTTDKVYDTENDYFDEVSPAFEDYTNRYYEVLVKARFRTELEAEFGKQLFDLADLSLKTFKPEILENLEEEMKLSSEYTKMAASAKLEFRGGEYNLSSIQPFEIDPDRQTRKEASDVKWGFWAANAEKSEGIYDRMVKVRHNMARQLGFDTFTALGYARMQRVGYTPEMVASFRENIRLHVVPLCQELLSRQASRIGVEKLMSYDEGLKFLEGNPKPQGTPEWIVDNASTMYKELSKETDEFFKHMLDAGMLDLLSKPGKAPGGYCTYIENAKSPFIYSNFNGTSGDIDVLTHEAGHAFQVFSSRNFPVPEYHFPTTEACEIHSMSMEFFTWRWMNLFFNDDAPRYYFEHMAASLLFLPYGVAVDEFQHAVYERPDMTPAERNQTWSAIEKKYLPHRDYDGNAFLEGGGFWQRQAHIFNSPFYYIDYVLAGICALQFWVRMNEDFEGSWKDYVNLCQQGGSKSFLELVEVAGLESPFADGMIERVAKAAGEWLAQQKF